MTAHPTAILDRAAKIPGSCKIGPYCTVGADVELGEGCELISHVAVKGPTTIGARNRFFPFSSIGLAPQVLSYKGEPTLLDFGDDETIREFFTINLSTAKGRVLTRIGVHTLIMANSYVAHPLASLT